MALTDYKITDAQVSTKGVVSAPDKLTGTAQENKAVFDKLIREAVKNDLNGLIDALVEAGVGSEVLLPNNAGMKYIRLNNDLVLETSTDGTNWQATGSSGHIIVDAEGNTLTQRSRLKFAEGYVEDDAANGVTIVHGGVAPQIIKVALGSKTGTGGSVTWSKSNAAITANHEVLSYSLSAPAAQIGDLTWTTSAGAISVSGNINGTTTLTVILGIVGTSVT